MLLVTEREGVRRASHAARLEEREHHHGLAEPHVVREASAEPESLEEGEPAERLALITAEGALERRRRIGGTNPFERLELGPDPRERLVPRRLGLRREERVEERGLRRLEAQVIAGGGAEERDGRVAPQPFFRQQADGAVAKRDERFPAAQRREQRGKRCLLVVERN